MPRVIRLRYHVEPLPVGPTGRFWAQLLTRDEMNRVHEWCEPWPLLWTLSDVEALNYCRRYHDVGPAFFIQPKEFNRLDA